MKVNDNVKPVVFTGEHGETLSLVISNMGEPYRDGINFSAQCENDWFSAFLEVHEIKKMRDFFNEYLQDI
jgi:hypothetical protein